MVSRTLRSIVGTCLTSDWPRGRLLRPSRAVWRTWAACGITVRWARTGSPGSASIREFSITSFRPELAHTPCLGRLILVVCQPPVMSRWSFFPPPVQAGRRTLERGPCRAWSRRALFGLSRPHPPGRGSASERSCLCRRGRGGERASAGGIRARPLAADVGGQCGHYPPPLCGPHLRPDPCSSAEPRVADILLGVANWGSTRTETPDDHRLGPRRLAERAPFWPRE